MQPSYCPLLLCMYLPLVLSCFLYIPPAGGFFVPNCKLKGSLKYPSNLKALCSKRELDVIPHKVPENARVLDLSYNRIRNVNKKDLMHLTELGHLNMSYNMILDVEDGAFGNLKALQELNLGHNKLSTVSEQLFQNLVNLIVLRLDENQIENISISAFDSLVSLQLLNLTGNCLSDIYKAHAIFKLLNLQELHIGKNRFASFQSWQISNTSLQLKVLDLSENPLEVFRITADIFPQLKSLDLAFRNGSMYWYVQDKKFLGNVTMLNLNGMQRTRQEIELLLETFNTSLTKLRLHQFVEDTVKPLVTTACLINTLTTIHLTSSNLRSISEVELMYCKDVLTLDLAENSLNNITHWAFRSMDKLNTLYLSYNKLNTVPTAIGNLSSLKILDLSYNSIHSLTHSDFYNLTELNMLIIYGNSLSFIENCAFQNLGKLRYLRIDSGRLFSVTNSFKTCLQKLNVLNLAQNKLNSIHKGDFGDLYSLTHLLLNDNQITTIEQGAFKRLGDLKVLNLQSNKITKSSITVAVLSGLTNLKVLLLNNNYISYNDPNDLKQPPFVHLKSLDHLAIHSQGHKGMTNIPFNFLVGLTSLQKLTAANLNLNSLHYSTFSHTPKLWHLDLSRNEFISLSSQLFKPLKNLKTLHLPSTGLQSLDFLMQANLTEIQFLQVSKNALSVINDSVIIAFRKLTYIDLQGNTFTCDCSNAWFIDWVIRNTDTQVINADQLTCNYPSRLRGDRLMELDLESCSVDVGFVCFISTTILISLNMLISVLYHFLKWQVVYVYYKFLAYLYESKQHRKGVSSDFQYDAFISYNTHDELWVMRELLPQLEGKQGWKLCLHHRDFQPGKCVVDNIVDGIYGSRKTICVISRHYLESEWCSRELQVASFRLFDEKKDVLILVFLEDIPTHQLSPYYRMRKLIKKRTYLSWPKPEQDIRIFWQKLRVALETSGTAEDESLIPSRIGRT
ncbi:uncharacterized protein LOC143484434 isoform X1 [Brachyhypopomus gauderio]|uniref:uncharacterized protein LOC143484434 isoform X1 n=1 Tax=Brachyhypopomus gauderio TaxID=698409 RepID=UPI0040415635